VLTLGAVLLLAALLAPLILLLSGRVDRGCGHERAMTSRLIYLAVGAVILGAASAAADAMW